MTKFTSSMTIATLLAVGLHVAPAHAQLARTFVSSFGSDANDCNRFTPCRTFQRAHNQALALGEITVLDPGGYGAVTITKGISIINDGVGEAGVLVSGGLNGITINAGVSDHVSLRGLTIKGIGFGGGNGILFNSGSSLTVENCVIRSLTGAAEGIWFKPTGGSSRLTVSNTLITDNTASGIFVEPIGAAFVTVVLNVVGMYNNGWGFVANGTSSTNRIVAAITDSIAAHSTFAGFFAGSDAAHAPTYMVLDRSVAAGNGVGVRGDSSLVHVAVGRSMLTNNALAWQANGGAVVASYGDNQVVFNFDGSPAAPSGFTLYK